MTVRRLVLLRHAQAEDGLGADLERALTARGREDARAAGAWVRGRGRHPYGLAMVSTARRARETYSLMVEGGAGAEEMWSEPRLYEASGEEYLRVLTDTPAEVKRLLVVAHMPGVAQAAMLLADQASSDAAAWESLVGGVPTCSLVVLETEDPWSEIREGSFRLVEVHTARAEGHDEAPEPALV